MQEFEAPSEQDDALQRLDIDVKRFKIDFERFFNGNLARPPEQMRQNIQKRIHYLQLEPMKTVAQRFRLSNLEARFNTLCVLFNRRLREREQGWSGPRPDADAAARFDTSKGVVLGAKAEVQAVRALYEGLYGGSGRNKKADFDSFQTYLKQQTAKIREKTGCTEVSFRVTEEKGRLKLKAKPV